MSSTRFSQEHVQRLQAAAAARLHSFHSPKRQLVGTKAVPAPAWKANITNGMNGAKAGADPGKEREVGSKILLSKLPVDVTPGEVEDLFKKTIGPLKDMFLVYNSQGNSKGMAVVEFTRPGDATLARQKYDGKIVDGRKRIKVEVIYDGVPPSAGQIFPTVAPTLLNRLGGKIIDAPSGPKALLVPTTPPLTLQQRTQIPAQIPAAPARRVRFKKGPKRLKKKHVTLSGTTETLGAHVKKGPVTKDALDKEMEDYRSAANV